LGGRNGEGEMETAWEGKGTDRKERIKGKGEGRREGNMEFRGREFASLALGGIDAPGNCP